MKNGYHDHHQLDQRSSMVYSNPNLRPVSRPLGLALHTTPPTKVDNDPTMELARVCLVPAVSIYHLAEVMAFGIMIIIDLFDGP